MRQVIEVSGERDSLVNYVIASIVLSSLHQIANIRSSDVKGVLGEKH